MTARAQLDPVSGGCAYLSEMYPTKLQLTIYDFQIHYIENDGDSSIRVHWKYKKALNDIIADHPAGTIKCIQYKVWCDE